MCVNAATLFRYRKNVTVAERYALLSHIVLPALAMLVQIFVYGIALLNLAAMIALLIIFLLIQVQQTRTIQQQELELADSRVSVMLSQIQPHFLYNALTAIKQLCESDPKQAKEAIVKFSLYLRGNLDALTIKQLIPFNWEMEHVRNYLSLEKKRIGDRVKIVYDLEETGFLIPLLTVQAIVENAVRHGITKQESGDTVRIASRQTKNFYEITVSDNGVGVPSEFLRTAKSMWASTTFRCGSKPCALAR